MTIYDTITHVAERIFDTLPRSLKRMSKISSVFAFDLFSFTTILQQYSKGLLVPMPILMPWVMLERFGMHTDISRRSLKSKTNMRALSIPTI